MNFNKINFLQIFFLGILIRCSVIIYLSFNPLNHDIFGYISSFHYIGDKADWIFYREFASLNILDKIARIYEGIYTSIFIEDITLIGQPQYVTFRRFPGFTTSFILFLFPYEENNFIFYAISLILVDFICFFIWLKYIYYKLGKISSLIFIFIPTSFYFFIFHSFDIWIYLAVTACVFIFLNLHLNKNINKNSIYLILTLLLFGFLKPFSLIFIIIAIIYYLFFYFNKNKKYYLFYYISLLLTVSLYFYPYYIYELNSVLLQQNDNLFIFKFSQIFNFIKLMLLKSLKIHGIGFSYSSSLIILIIRNILGLYLLFGFILSFFYYKVYKIFSIILIINFIFVLLFLYPSYRYILPLAPVYSIFILHFFNKFFFNRFKNNNESKIFL